MADAMTTTSEAPNPPAKSFFTRLVGVFISPGETFADIAQKPDFIVPLIVVIVLNVAGTEAFLAKIGIEPVIRWAMEHSSRTANMTPEQIQQTITRMVGIQTILAHVASVLWIPFVTLIVALIGWVTVKTIFGAEISFKTAFSVAAYAYLVNIIYVVITGAMIFLGDPAHAISNPQNLGPTSLGFFLNPVDTPKPLLALGGSLEIFTIWYMVLLGLGFSEASHGKAKFVSVFLVFLGLWLVMTLAKMGLATLG
jgi:hypothetical protein